MLLTHISSFWRTTAHCTPPLWNRISVTSSEHSLAGIRTILERSGSLPLEIMLDRTGPLDSRASFLPLLWDFHDRIEVLSLDLPASHLLPNILPIQTRLPLLRLLDLVIEEGDDEEGTSPLPAVLDLFREAPALRELEFSAKYSTEIRTSVFPWAQLTSLLSVMAMDTNSVHDMLRRCPRLESCTFGSLEASDVEQSRFPPSTSSALHSLELNAITDGVSTGFFESLTFPALKSLNLSFAVPIEDLLASCLHLEGPKYYFEVEDLLAEVSAAGYIVDYCVSECK
ncbi:hypothetical protein C8R43DRAFT_1140389 [Mycena crocata]|nr:hypothetical protein C8R43DRAFT_1140389 [Mycena crocata]